MLKNRNTSIKLYTMKYFILFFLIINFLTPHSVQASEAADTIQTLVQEFLEDDRQKNQARLYADDQKLTTYLKCNELGQKILNSKRQEAQNLYKTRQEIQKALGKKEGVLYPIKIDKIQTVEETAYQPGKGLSLAAVKTCQALKPFLLKKVKVDYQYKKASKPDSEWKPANATFSIFLFGNEAYIHKQLNGTVHM